MVSAVVMASNMSYAYFADVLQNRYYMLEVPNVKDRKEKFNIRKVARTKGSLESARSTVLRFVNGSLRDSEMNVCLVAFRRAKSAHQTTV